MSLGDDTLAQVITDALEARLAELHVCMPGQVQSYDSATGLAQVQPCLKRKFQDGTLVALPVISNVPVCFPRTAGSYVHMPLAAGDYVTLVFSERCLDAWISTGGIVDPQDPRKHHLSDAYAIPGGFPQASPVKGLPNGADLVLSNGTALLQLQKGGTFLMKGAGGKELFDLLDQLLAALIAAKTTTMMGPQNFYPATISTLTQIKADIDALKGS